MKRLRCWPLRWSWTSVEYLLQYRKAARPSTVGITTASPVTHSVLSGHPNGQQPVPWPQTRPKMHDILSSDFRCRLAQNWAECLCSDAASSHSGLSHDDLMLGCDESRSIAHMTKNSTCIADRPQRLRLRRSAAMTERCKCHNGLRYQMVKSPFSGGAFWYLLVALILRAMDATDG